MLDIATNTNTIITTPCCFSLISHYCAHFVQETGTSISNCWFWSTLLRNTSVFFNLYTFLRVRLSPKQVKLYQMYTVYYHNSEDQHKFTHRCKQVKCHKFLSS